MVLHTGSLNVFFSSAMMWQHISFYVNGPFARKSMHKHAPVRMFYGCSPRLHLNVSAALVPLSLWQASASWSIKTSLLWLSATIWMEYIFKEKKHHCQPLLNGKSESGVKMVCLWTALMCVTYICVFVSTLRKLLKTYQHKKNDLILLFSPSGAFERITHW